VAVVGGEGIEGGVTRRPLRILGRVLVGVAVVWVFTFFLTRRTLCVMPGPTKARADLAVIADALASFALVNDGSVPSELSALWRPDSRGLRFIDLREPPLDPWDRPYLYEPPSDAVDSFRVFSLGEDGRPGGEGEDADIEIVRTR
jgi:type II secretion system (T2SS) protein G